MGGDPPAGVRTIPPVAADATTIVLVRHGESACSVAGVVGGPNGCRGLTANGRRQVADLRDWALRTGAWRGADALYSSTLPRAVETAEILAPAVGPGPTPAAIRCSHDLVELRPGAADGLAWDEFTRCYGEPDWDRDPTTVLAPGGESWSTFLERAEGVLHAIAEHHGGELVVIACHGGIIEASLMVLLPVTSRTRLGLRTAYASFTEWERDATGWRLLRYNAGATPGAGAA